MSDIWSNVGGDMGTLGDEWLYHLHGEIRGPVPIEMIVARLVAGEIDAMTPVAREGGEFHPMAQVKAFESHLDDVRKKLRKQAARKVRNVILVMMVCIIAAAGGVGYWLLQRAERLRAEQALALKQAEDEAAAKRAAIENELKGIGKSDLVALVSLGDIKDMKIGGKSGKPAAKKVASKRNNQAEADSKGPGTDEMMSQCQRGQGDIFGVLGKHIAKLNICVEDEKSRNASGLPDKLVLDFVVKPDGGIVEFDIDHRFFRSGPMKNCMVKVFRTIRFPAVGGTTCPVSIPIKIGG